MGIGPDAEIFTKCPPMAAVGDEVEIRCDSLGALLNTVDRCDAIPRWTFGIGALMHNLALRGREILDRA